MRNPREWTTYWENYCHLGLMHGPSVSRDIWNKYTDVSWISSNWSQKDLQSFIVYLAACGAPNISFSLTQPSWQRSPKSMTTEGTTTRRDLSDRGWWGCTDLQPSCRTGTVPYCDLLMGKYRTMSDTTGFAKNNKTCAVCTLFLFCSLSLPVYMLLNSLFFR